MKCYQRSRCANRAANICLFYVKQAAWRQEAGLSLVPWFPRSWAADPLYVTDYQHAHSLYFPHSREKKREERVEQVSRPCFFHKNEAGKMSPSGLRGLDRRKDFLPSNLKIRPSSSSRYVTSTVFAFSSCGRKQLRCEWLRNRQIMQQLQEAAKLIGFMPVCVMLQRPVLL